MSCSPIAGVPKVVSACWCDGLNNTIWHSNCGSYTVMLTIQISIVCKDETTPIENYLGYNKCTLDNKPHLSCCGVISACAYQPNSMVLAQHIIWVFLCLFIHLLHIPFICGVSFSRHKNLIELILFKLHAPWLFVLQQCYHIILYSCSRTKVVMATIIQNYSPLSALWMWFVLGHIQHNWLASGLIMQTCIWYN